ncbi:hypothetical protein Tco_1545197 [Tanacetum coccineum]
MTTANQGISIEEIEQIVGQQVANAIEAIVIYETKTSMTREAMSQTKQQGDKKAEVTCYEWKSGILQEEMSTSEGSEPCGQVLERKRS